jgi:hypothetical protein
MMPSALGVLPLMIAWIGLLLLARDLAARGIIANRWSLHWAFASICWGVILALFTEVASLFGAVNGPMLLSAWLALDMALLLILMGRKESIILTWRGGIERWRAAWANCPRDASILLMMIAALVSALFTVALFTATTNWDSLTYHLPRMLHWLQQGTVDHFPTNNFRQVEFAPWASYALMHVHALTGNDQLLNLMQWGAMLSTLIVISYVVLWLAECVGVVVDLHSTEHGPGSWRLVAFTLLIVATIPIGVIESITTQNDYVVIFWLCCAVAFGMALVSDPRNMVYALGAGAALGLATLTKSTAFVYAAPFALAFGVWWLLRISGIGSRVRVACAVGSAFLVLNCAHMMRNQVAAGSPLGSPHIFKLERNERLTARNTCSNFIRNLSLNSNSGFTPVTRILNGGLGWLHRLIGADLNDPGTTYHGCRFFFREKFLVCDSYTSNTWHVLLFGAALTVALCRPRLHAKALLYGTLVTIGVMLFCFYLKWQWWHSRLHLGFLVLAAPFAGLVLARNLSRLPLAVMGVLLTLFAAFTLLKNQSRPFFSREFASLPREQKYLSIDGAHLNAPLSLVADAIVASDSKRIGLNLPFDAAEYPLWVMLRTRGFNGRIDHVSANSSDYEVVLGSLESPWQMDRALYRYSRKAGYYTLLWKEQPSFGVEVSKAEGD